MEVSRKQICLGPARIVSMEAERTNDPAPALQTGIEVQWKQQPKQARHAQ